VFTLVLFGLGRVHFKAQYSGAILLPHIKTDKSE
jgi:hypothetical protein